MNNTVLFRYGGEKLYLFVGPETVLLANFSTKNTRQGDGTRCMELAVAWADQYGRTMRLEACGPEKDGLSNKQLVEFYKRFGFVEDSSWAGTVPVRMIRVVR